MFGYHSFHSNITIELNSERIIGINLDYTIDITEVLHPSSFRRSGNVFEIVAKWYMDKKYFSLNEETKETIISHLVHICFHFALHDCTGIRHRSAMCQYALICNMCVILRLLTMNVLS